MAARLTRWQQTVQLVLENLPLVPDDASGWEHLTEDERQGMRWFAQAQCGDDAVRAEEMLRQAAQSRSGGKTLALLGRIGAITLACGLLAVAVGLSWRAMAAWAALMLAALVVNSILTARRTRMLRLWQQHEGSADSVADTLKRMYRVSLRSPFAAANKVLLAVLLLGSLLCAVLTVAPEPQAPPDRQLRQMAARLTGADASLAEARALLVGMDNPAEVLTSAWNKSKAGSDERYLLAALAADEAIDFPDDVLQAWVASALRETDVRQLATPAEKEALPILLARADTALRPEALRSFLTGDVPAEMLRAFGEAMGGDWDDDTLLGFAGEIRQAGKSELDFLQAAFAGRGLQDAEASVRAADDADKALLLRAYAPAITQLDDVLALLRLGREAGVLPSVLYPEGAPVELDTAAYDLNTAQNAASLGRRDTFLILRRTEDKEPFTTLEVEAGDQVQRHEELPDMLYDNYDPDADRGGEAYTVTLETAVLDTVPTEHIPDSLAACDVLVFLDTSYYCEGYIRTRHDRYVDGKMVTRQRDTPCFACVQAIAVFNAATAKVLFVHDQVVLRSPAMQEQDLEGKDVLDWVPAQHYIAEPDPDWFTDGYAQFLYALERRGWKLVP